MNNDNKLMPSAIRWGVVGLAALAAIGGGVTLVGWFAELPRLTDWLGTGISMFPNTAFVSICAGAALVLATLNRRWATRLSVILGLFVAMVGGATLFQHVSGIDLGIDTLLKRPTWGSKVGVPGRMGPPASTSFILLGIALIFIGSRGGRARRAVPALGICVCLFATLALMGYVTGADRLYDVARLTEIAMQTASILLALGLAVVSSVPEHEPMRTLRQKTAQVCWRGAVCHSSSGCQSSSDGCGFKANEPGGLTRRWARRC
jgi:hypothetical protein